MDDLAVKNKIREFKDGYLFSCEDDGRRKHEVYTIQSPELKAILREIAFSGETDDFFSRKAEIGSRNGNYSSYEEDVDNNSDRFIITRLYSDGDCKKEVKSEGQKERKEKADVPVVRDIQVTGWQRGDSEAERWRREAEEWRQQAKEAGFPIDLPYEERVREVERRRAEAEKSGSPMGSYVSTSIRQGNQLWEKRNYSQPDSSRERITEIVDEEKNKEEKSSSKCQKSDWDKKGGSGGKGTAPFIFLGLICFVGVVGVFASNLK